jgi:hypothetical protein
MFEKSIINSGARPKTKDECGSALGTFFRTSFVDNPKRPSMTNNCKLLRDEINKLSDKEIVEILDASRNSQLSFRKSVEWVELRSLHVVRVDGGT